MRMTSAHEPTIRIYVAPTEEDITQRWRVWEGIEAHGRIAIKNVVEAGTCSDGMLGIFTRETEDGWPCA
jgi:hypothetical protein